MTTIETYRQKLEANSARLLTARLSRNVPYDEVEALERERWVLLKESVRLYEEYQMCRELQKLTYQRPTGGFNTFINSLLPPPPDPHFAVQPSKEVLRQLPSMYGKATLVVGACFALMLLLGLIAPWTLVFPASVAISVIEPLVGGSSIIAAVIVFAPLLYIVLLHVRRSKSTTLHWDWEKTTFAGREAADKEHWFRSGSENWSIPMQLWSSMLFAVSTVTVFMPVALIVATALFGFILTRTYISAYQKSGLTDTGILTATKLHMAVQRIGIVFIFLFVGAYYVFVMLPQ